MNRYAIENLFGIEGLNIAWYGIIIACGMVLGFALVIYRCRKTGINKEHIYDLALWLIPVCIICARAYYVIFEWDNYKNDLLDCIDRHPLTLSGGQRQRLAICQAIMGKKKFLIFDEPTSGLDFRHMCQATERLKQLAQHGYILFVVTHDYEF